VLLLQKGFWVGSTDDPAATAEKHLPDNLWEMGFITLGGALVLLVIGQLVFSKLENKIPERL